MALFQEIFTQERSTTVSITLRREGIFYKAYNESAYLFCRYVRAYQVKVRYVKKAHQYSLSVGFPAAQVEKVMSRSIPVQGELLSLQVTGTPLVRSEYDAWKEHYLQPQVPAQAPVAAQPSQAMAGAPVAPATALQPSVSKEQPPEPLAQTELQVAQSPLAHSGQVVDAPCPPTMGHPVPQGAVPQAPCALTLSLAKGLIDRIRSFQLNNATPMECMNFLNQLQCQLSQETIK